MCRIGEGTKRPGLSTTHRVVGGPLYYCYSAYRLGFGFLYCVLARVGWDEAALLGLGVRAELGGGGGGGGGGGRGKFRWRGQGSGRGS